MKQIAISIVLSIALLSLHSCKEGCRDPKAMNYDSKATNDNASCLFCNDTTTLQYDLITVKDLINNSSPYYKHDIIQARVYSTTHTIAGNGCGAIGKTNVKTNITNITLVNLTSKLITISFSIFHYGTNHITYDFYFSGYNILHQLRY